MAVETTGHSWLDVWSSRSVAAGLGSALEDLLSADGYDTPFASIRVADWLEYVRKWAARLGVVPGSSVFEVGCGAGAFLAPLQSLGVTVGGCDVSPSLLELARRALPGAHVWLAEAALIEPEPSYDFVIANSVFAYCPDLDYARRVLERMVGKARRGVAVIDIPDARGHDEERKLRARAYGNSAAYQERYKGLEHLVYERSWFEAVLHELGAVKVTVADIELVGCVHGSTRFGVVANLAELAEDP